MQTRDKVALCRIDCAFDLSTCGDSDNWMTAACLACEASCSELSEVTCAGEGPGFCPEPCACE